MTSLSTATQSISFLTPSTAAASSPHDQVSQGTELSQNGAALSPFVPIGQSSSFTQTHGSNKCQGPNSIFSNSFMPNFAEANALLNLFRDQITPHFPFIVLPQSVSAEELYLERPFLYISILAITSRDCVQQEGLGKLVMKQLAERMFVYCERSLDLLLGVLTYAGWFVHHIIIMSRFLVPGSLE
jgi:hypothetical protein